VKDPSKKLAEPVGEPSQQSGGQGEGERYFSDIPRLPTEEGTGMGLEEGAPTGRQEKRPGSQGVQRRE
jgi:hypothetical protein